VAWKRSVALLQVREEEEEDKGEKRRREEKSVAWRRSAALLQAKEEEEEDRREKRREILIGADQDQNLFFFLLRLSRVFKQEVMSLVFSRWCC
jgi:hypothetical protein